MEPRPDKEDPEITPSNSEPGDLAPDERDVWPSDEDEDEAEAEAEGTDEFEEEPEDDDLEEDDPLDAEFYDEEDDPLDDELDDEEDDPLDDELDDEEEADEFEPDPDSKPAPAPPKATEESDSILPRFSRKDLIWLGVLGAAVLGIAVYAVNLFFGDINTSTPDKVHFPVKGENLVIRKIETYWRKPDRDSDLGVRLSAEFIPAADITLKSSDSGALRFFFANPEGDRIGDSVTLSFSGGSFETSGSETATFNGTGGFEDVGDYNDYLTEKVHFWHLVVMEGPSRNAEGSEFKEILKMRISPKRR